MMSKNSTFDIVKSDMHFDRLKVPFFYGILCRESGLTGTLK